MAVEVTAVVAVDVLLDRERHADAVLADAAERARAAGADAVTGATHWAEVAGERRILLTVEADGIDERALAGALDSRGTSAEPARTAALAAAVRAHRDRTSGRVAVLPGAADLPPALPVRDLLRRTPVDRVVELAAGDADPAAVLTTRGYLRPRWEGGALVLHVQPAAGGTLVPFEVPDPTPCCAAHT